ncbi:hypothetical protein BLA60_09625 [Actinophytocola xinjiangensis]|uniref:HTH cro/C1-type domain-containing protein n=1 Tax=Actinophytocola xinjiangensis TaxID=485602 RepID=A0A7Z0WQG5_9PSEU|nr:helix-turn-helix transcriptional regulator [Actinophytocola xinjiangensis]OLF12239.1 hypothetical protein BLA60_09625 [Actinophytocola xinjiangensis]
MQMRHSSAAYRDLGRLLRETRKKSGLSSERLAKKMGWPLTTISRMENGGRVSSTTDVIQFAVSCGLKAGAELDRLIEFTRMAELDRGYYLSDARIGGSLQSLILYESSAESSTIYEPQVIHGLLQTPAYARALIAALNANISEDRVSAAILTRMQRRRILSVPDSARFTFYFHENALRLQVGTDKIMHEQLLHIVLTAALDRVTVRIVPSSTGERCAFGGPFQLMEFDRHRPIVYLDNFRVGGLILDDSDHVCSYGELVPTLDDLALDEGQSREFVASLADEFDRGSQRSGAVGLAQEQLQRRRGNELRGGLLAQEQPQRRLGV